MNTLWLHPRFKSFSFFLPIFLLLVLASGHADKAPSEVVQGFQYNTAIQASQDSIGRVLSRHRFTDTKGRGMTMHDFAGKPLIISMVYSSCYQICPMTIRHLSGVVDKARDTLSVDSFNVAVIGFDSQYDNPQNMKHFAEKQGIDKKGWYVLSADAETIALLSAELGFVYFASPNGFDHAVQATVVDGKGEIYRQVYGETFDTQLLLQPLLDLVWDRPRIDQSFFAGMVDKVRFFCTTYDPRTDSYRFDYSLFIGMTIGAIIILLTLLFIINELRLGKHS